MSLTEKLELLVSMDPSQAQGAFKEIGDKAEQHGARAENAIGKITSSMTKIGVAGVGVGAILTEMGSKEQASDQQMEASITQVGQSYEEFKGRIDATVSSQEKYGHSAVETQNAVSTLTLAYGDTGKALDQMQLAADLAAKKHISLEEAATAVAKAHGGAGRLFKEFGIVVQQNADGTKNYDGALGELSQKLTGQASAASDTFMGHLAGIKAHVEDVVAEFGQNFGPAILGISSAFTVLGPTINSVNTFIKAHRTVTTEDTVAEEGNTVATEENTVAKQENAVATEENSGAGRGLAGTLGMAGVAGAALIGVGALYQYGQSLNKTGLDQKDLEKISSMTWENQTQMVLQMVDKFKGPMAQSIDDVITHYKALGAQGVTEMQKIRDRIAETHGDTSKWDKAIADVTQSQENMTGPVDKATDSIKAQDDALKALHDTTHAQLDPLFGFVKAQEANKKAQEDVTAKTWLLIDAQKKYGPSSMEAAAAQDALDQAQHKTVDSAFSLSDAQQTLEEKIRTGTVTLDGAKRKLEEWVKSGYITQAEADAMARSFDGAAWSANSIPGQVTTTIYADTRPAEERIHNFMNSVADLQVVVAVSGSGGTMQIRQHGGFVEGPPGSPVPILAHAGEFVLTAEQTRSLMAHGFNGSAASSGSGMTVDFHAPIYNMAPSELVDELEWRVRAGKF